MQIARTLIIILIILYVVPWVLRKVGPFLLKRFVEKKMGAFQSQQQAYFNQQQQEQEEARRREGEVNIKYNQHQSSHSTSNSTDIEDVDFEEIKE